MAVTVVLVNCSHGPRYQLRMKQMLLRWGCAPPCWRGPPVRSEWKQECVCSPCFPLSSWDMQSAVKALARLFLNEPLWKARSRFSFHYGCFYISGCWMSTSSLIWLLELLKGKGCVCAQGCVCSVCSYTWQTPSSPPPPSPAALCLSCQLPSGASTLVSHSAERTTPLSVIHTPRSALTNHLPTKTNSVPHPPPPDSEVCGSRPAVQHGPVFSNRGTLQHQC